jgi:SAM-dependent methyltransferase
MSGAIWKDPTVAASFLDRRSDVIPDRARQLEVLFRLLGMRQGGITRVLDVGAGDAITLATVLEAYPEAEGVAVDFSPHMLEQARARLARFGARARTVEGDLGSAGWHTGISGPFDAVVSSFAIHHLTDGRKRALYGEVHTLLGPGGIFLNVEHVASATPHVEEAFEDMMIEHQHASRRARGEEITLETVRREFKARPDRADNILAPVERQCGWLREIGYTDVDCFWKYFELAIFGGFRAVA